MPRVRPNATKDQRSEAARVAQQTMPIDDGTLTTPVTLAMIQTLIPLGLKAVEEALLQEVTQLAGPRYARNDAHLRIPAHADQRIRPKLTRDSGGS